MNARILFILLIISVLLAFSQRYRKIGVGLSVVLVVLLLWFTFRPPAPDQPSPVTANNRSSSTAASSPSTGHLVAMQLEGNGAPWRLTGAVQNTSAHTIRSVRIHIERWDCPTADATQEACVLLWQGTHVLRANIPAGASLQVNDSFYSHDPVARLRAVARDRMTITKVE